MSVQSVFFTTWQGSCVLHSAHITKTKYREWKVDTFPEFRKYYKTECHNSVRK